MVTGGWMMNRSTPIKISEYPVSSATIVAAPGGKPLLGHALQFRNDPLALFEFLRDQGDIVSVTLGPLRAYVLSSPDLIREVLVAKARSFDKGAQIQGARDLFGNGLVASEGEEHRRQRLLMQPAFRRERIANYAVVMREEIVSHLDTWQDGRVVDVRVEMTALALAVASKTLISSEIGEKLSTEVKYSMPRLLDLLFRRMTNPVPVLKRLPLPSNREYKAILERFHGLVDVVISERRRDTAARNDLLSMLLEARGEDGEPLSDQEIHDQMVAIIIAGSETTGAMLSWAFHTFGENPEIEARVHAEVDEVLGGRPAEYADVPQLAYTAQVVSETLRLYPPGWILTRRATADTEIGEYRIPAGTDLLMSPYAVQRDSRLFPNATTFDPDRWSPERVTEIPRHAMLQFSAGPRKCIGDVFAVVEGTLALATIAGSWRLRPQPGTRMEKVAASTYTTRNQLMITEKRGS
ncbi:cytochrome P450 [Nocardia stercoris]|uniref:Cytochrome P450 n=1 Tax=Nocardia stercoris TaxID=2483361 RepID=A0A3M2L3K1_9NOCA|nr:cytochrome P450 [Nocardia stercoris]RMI32121.1 cytochrome P450 [Nocardia stercoris]